MNAEELLEEVRAPSCEGELRLKFPCWPSQAPQLPVNEIPVVPLSDKLVLLMSLIILSTDQDV